MRMMRKILPLLLSIFIVCACDKKDAGQVAAVVVGDESTTLVEQEEFDKMFKRISVIPLETKDECIISSIKKTVEADGNIYVLSEDDGGQTSLYRFDDEGRFLNRIGEMGNAQNEYNCINSFFVTGGDVYLLDSYLQKMLRCTREGKCIDVVSMGETLKFIRDAQVLEDSKTVLLSYGINFGEKHALYRLVDIATGNILWEQTTRYTAGGNIPHAIQPVAVCGEKILLTMPMDKCIYSLNTKDYSVDKALDVECYGKLIVPETDDYMEAQRNLEGGSTIIKVSGSGNLIMMSFFSGSVVWDIEKKQGMRIDNGIDYSQCKTIPCVPQFIVSSTGTWITTCRDAKNLKECLEKMGDTEFIDVSVLPDSKDANPVLIRHYLK